MLGTIVEERYLVEAELGAGAMGHVYRARHIKVGRQVAIKVMHAELARVPTIVERFAREARIAARLDHPNLVSVLDVGVTPDARRLPLLVLELAPGTSMVDLTLDAMPREHVVSLIRQLLRGLDHAHAAGLVHRDLKPDNILVEQLADGSYVPRIVDFGIAVCNREDDPIANLRLTEANTVIGTPFYMSPEQALAKPLDARSDLFSLGVIMYELLAGMPPFPGSGLDVAYQNATKDAPAIVERAGIHVDPLLEAFVQKLMARRLDERFQSAHDALVMLDLIESDRIAAGRALSGSTPDAAVAPVGALAEGSGPVAAPVPGRAISASDAPSMASSSPDGTRAPPPIGAPTLPATHRPTTITRVEHVDAMRPRRRALWGAALAAAALTAIVGWSAGIRPDAPRATAQASLAPSSAVHAPSLTATPIRAEDATSAPQPVAAKPAATPGANAMPAIATARPAPTTTRPAPTTTRPAPAATSTVAAPPAPIAASTAAAPASGSELARPPAPIAASTAAARPAPIAASTAAAPPAPIAASTAAARPAPIAASAAANAPPAATASCASAADGRALAARYIAVGRALRGAPDELWARYRLIRINEALATASSRTQALLALAEIERAIRK